MRFAFITYLLCLAAAAGFKDITSDHSSAKFLLVNVYPTGEPSSVPTGEPSSVPTGEPSSVPTGEPSAVPTGEPTAVPTGEPSAVPTGEPTSVPTAIPTPVSAPVAAPKTYKPSLSPTDSLPLPDCSMESPACDLSATSCTPTSFLITMMIDGVDPSEVNDGLSNLVCTVAALAKVSSKTVAIRTVSKRQFSSKVFSTALKETSSVDVTFEITLISGAYGFASDVIAYETISSRLQLSVESGDFTTLMNNLGSVTDGHALAYPASVKTVASDPNTATAAPSEKENFAVSGVQVDKTSSESSTSLMVFIYSLCGVVGLICCCLTSFYVWRKYSIPSDKLNDVSRITRTDVTKYNSKGIEPSQGDPVEWFDSAALPKEKKYYYL